MHLIDKVKRKIRISNNSASGNSKLNDGECLLNKKRGSKHSSKRRNRKSDGQLSSDERFFSSCSITASISSDGSSLLFDDLDSYCEDAIALTRKYSDLSLKRSTIGGSKKQGLGGVEYKPLPKFSMSASKSMDELEVQVDDITSSEEELPALDESLVSNDSPGHDEEEKNQDRIPYDSTDDITSWNNQIIPLSSQKVIDFNAFESDDPLSDRSKLDHENQLGLKASEAIQLHSNLEIVSDFDRFMSYVSDKMNNLCESPANNNYFSSPTSLFNFDVHPVTHTPQAPQPPPPNPPAPVAQERRMVQFKATVVDHVQPTDDICADPSSLQLQQRPVDAIADGDGLVHIFHDKLATLYECPRDEKQLIPIDDEDIIKARWAYAVEMMNLDARCGISNGYEVAEI